MINKPAFKLYLGMLAMLVGLTGCWGGVNKDVVPNDPSIRNINIEEAGKPTTYLLVGFAGLGGIGKHPEAWCQGIAEMIKDETRSLSISPQVLQLLVKRSSENKPIKEHVDEANQQILNHLLRENIEDFNNVKLVLVAESYGGLVAAKCALNNLNDIGISIAGLITIRTPLEGVSLVQAIPKVKSWVEAASVIPSWLQIIPNWFLKLKEITNKIREPLGWYDNCKEALETLHPDSSFIKDLRNGDLSKIKCPVLALAGQDGKPTGLYESLQLLPTFQQMVGPFIPQLSQQIEPVSVLLGPYQNGNDGLVTVGSATAANSIRGPKFQSYVFREFSHFGDTTKHSGAFSCVKDFIRQIIN